MGFLYAVPVNQSGTGSSSGSVTVSLPPSVQDGDEVWAVVLTGNQPTVAIIPPSGWTLLGSQHDGTSDFGGRVAIYYKTWHTGDNMSETFSIASSLVPWGWFSLIVRSDGAHSVVSDSDQSNTVSSTTVALPAFTPTSAATDLRIGVVAVGASCTLTTPAAALSDKNPSGRTFSVAPLINFVSSGKSAFLLWGHWSDTTGWDAGSVNATASSAGKSYARALVVNDGTTTRNGISGANEVELIDGIDPAITGAAMEWAEGSSLSATAGVFGGGAEIS